MDGLAVASWVNDRYPSVPIVLYPSQPSEALAAAAVNVEIDAYVPVRDGGSVDLLRSQLRRLTTRPTQAPGNEDEEQGRPSTASTVPAESMPMFEALLTSLPRWASIYVKDRLGRHLAVSGSAIAFDEESVITTADGKRLHSREDLLGKTDFDLYSPELAEETHPQERRIMQTEEPMVNFTESAEDPLGDTFHNSTTKAPWYDADGTVAGIVGITVEITDRIERERALERQNERLDRFAGVLSHDIRNPLAVATGQVDLLGEYDLPPGARDRLEDLEWSLDRIEALIEDTLALAREGAAVEDPVSVDLEDVVHSGWRVAGDDRGQLAIDGPLPNVSGDPDRIQRCFENLLVNALDHGRAENTPDTLTITVGAFDDGFYVADDGCGIPENRREEVLEHGYSTQDDGTGFGLAIVAEIAAAHEWTLEVVASEDGGARFEFHDVALVTDE